jgi:hypothetical protein
MGWLLDQAEPKLHVLAFLGAPPSKIHNGEIRAFSNKNVKQNHFAQARIVNKLSLSFTSLKKQNSSF